MEHQNFNMVSTVSGAYKFLWDQRPYLLRLCLLPFFILLACYVGVMVLDDQAGFVWQSLILLPGFFAEGWLVVHVIHFIFKNDNFTPHKKLTQAGIILYALIKFLIFGITGFLWQVLQEGEEMAHASGTMEISPVNFVLSLVFLVFFIRAFSWLFLFIPVSIGYRIKDYIIKFSDFRTSINMLASWFACFIPFSMLFTFIMSVILSVYSTPDSVPMLIRFSLTLIQVVMELTVTIVITACMASGIKQMIERK